MRMSRLVSSRCSSARASWPPSVGGLEYLSRVVAVKRGRHLDRCWRKSRMFLLYLISFSYAQALFSSRERLMLAVVVILRLLRKKRDVICSLSFRPVQSRRRFPSTFSLRSPRNACLLSPGTQEPSSNPSRSPQSSPRPSPPPSHPPTFPPSAATSSSATPREARTTHVY